MRDSFLFEQAIKAAKLGNRQSARQMLRQFLETNPDHELAWQWLGSLSSNSEEKIQALYEILRINPDNVQARADLNRLRLRQAQTTRQETEFENYRAQEAQEWLKLARQAQAAGDRGEALELLRQYTRSNDKNVDVWIWISQLAAGVEEKISALENALRLDPHSAEAKAQIQKLRAVRKDPLKLGIYYEESGDAENAIHQYILAAQSHPNRWERQEALQRLTLARIKLEAPAYKLAGPFHTLTRLALGPTLLYISMLLIHSGFNLFKAPPGLCLTAWMIPLGAVFLAATTTPELLYAWQNWLRKRGLIPSDLTSAGFWLAGLLLMLAPAAYMLLDGYLRIQALLSSLPGN